MHDPEQLMQRMKKRGWSDEEIQHAHAVFAEHEPKHRVLHPLYDESLHWVVFLAIIVGNFVIMFYLIPLIFVIRGFISYLIIAAIAVFMGMIFEVVINDITHLGKHHHFIIGVILPLISLLTFVLFLSFLMKTFETKSLNIFLVGFTYSFMFILPYYFRKIRAKVKSLN